MYEKRCAHTNATNDTTRWNKMKVIVNDNKKKKLANEDTCYGCEDELDEFLEDSEYVPMSIPILK